MTYNGTVYSFDETHLTQLAHNGQGARSARLEGDTLIMEGPWDKRVQKRDELPREGAILESGHPLVDRAFLIARRDLESNFYDGGIYAGTNFRSSVTWVRDTAFTSMMGLAGFYPEKISDTFYKLLDEDLKEVQFEQYRAFYEDRFFTMTDQILWVLAAEKLARVTGDYSQLRYGAPYALRTIRRIYEERYDQKTGLIAGGSSLFDGHSGFTKGMTGPHLRSCSNDLIYLLAYRLLQHFPGMGDAVINELGDLQESLQSCLDKELWLEEKGYYAQFHWGDNYREERLETLGNLIAAGNPDVPRDKAMAIFKSMPQYPYGLPALYPWYRERIWYHSGGIWPFMMGVAMWALRERGNDISSDEIAGTGADITYMGGQLIRTSMLEGTFMELLYCTNGNGYYSPAQVWSTGAMFALVEYGLFGMKFFHDRVEFAPRIPAFLRGKEINLRNFKLRGKEVTLAVSPDLQVSVDGKKLAGNVLPLAENGFSVPEIDRSVITETESIILKSKGDEPQRTEALAAAAGGVSLSSDVKEIVVSPAEEQIGSYAVDIDITNTGKEDADVTLTGIVDVPDLYVVPGSSGLAIGAGETVRQRIRVGFDTPPENLDRALVTTGIAGTDLRLEIPVRRLFNLDVSWRNRARYKQKSLSYERDLSEFETWDPIRVPMHAEFRLGPFTGVLWYAKKNVIPEAWAGKDLVFYCGAMSAWDRAYFNGQEIGRTGDETNSAAGQERKYRIPAEIVKPGRENTITVQVWCEGKDCGMYKGPVVLAPADEIDWAIEQGQKILDSNFIPETVKITQGNL